MILEVSAKVGRHFWRHPAVRLDAEDWSRLPGRFGADPAHQAEWGDLFAALRRAVDSELTPRQRDIFVAIVLNEVPLDTLVTHLGSSRNAIYQAMFEARASCGSPWLRTGTWATTLWGVHERLVGAGPALAD